jgi:holo-[acyl-carrier protein] synthase
LSLVGIGIDLVAVDRLALLMERHGDRFLARCFRNSSPADAGRDLADLAGRWAAKEAFLKALGSDVRGVPYRDIEIGRDKAGAPVITTHGRARLALAATGARRVHLSIGPGADYAVATVVLEK